MSTRSQQLMLLAEKLVSQVQKEEKALIDAYGRLCFTFPVLVQQSGLCQAIAFSLDKARSDEERESHRAQAHRLLLDHVAVVLNTAPGDLGRAVAEMDLGEYMLSTRIVLDAWVYFRRFAVSILKVKSAG
ncbi:MAG: type III-B CRISPR module-associated protein Cmr5 [Bacillota bacterium]